jgi:Domain of unknown function (DUF4440)
MSETSSAIVRAALVGVATAVAVIGSPGVAHADTCVDSGTDAPLPLDAAPCADVLAQEARWLTAITAGDVATVESILGPTFRHVNADGEPLDRAQEVAAMKPLPVTFDASDQTVDVYRDTAVIHGINTVTEGKKVVARERFIDVFLLQNGVWKALAAQETALQH